MFQEYAGTYLDIVKIVLSKFRQQEYIEVHYNEYFQSDNWNMEQNILYYDNTLFKRNKLACVYLLNVIFFSSLPCRYRTVKFWRVMFV